MSDVRIGMLGAGFVAEFYLRALESVRFHTVTVVASRNAEAAATLAKHFDVPTVVGSTEELAARDDVDLVVVALPHDSHVDAIETLAAAGKAVVCTKPLGRNADEAARCLSAVERAGVWHGYAESAVFVPSIVEARRLVDGGAIGDVTWVRAREAHAHPHGYARDLERMGGGPLRGIGIHCVALGRYFFDGALPVEVFAWGERLARTDVESEDSVLMIVRFADGRVTQVESAWTHVPGLDVRTEIHGSNGWIGTDETGSTGIRVFAGAGVGSVLEKAGSDRGWLVPVPDEPAVYGYQGELDHFVRAFRAGEPPRQTLRDGVIDNAIVDAGYVSMRERRWVPVGYPDVVGAP